MSSQENKKTYASIIKNVTFKGFVCAVAPTLAVKALSSSGAQNFINSLDDQPIKPLFTVCILNVISSDITDLFEKIYEDSSEIYGNYIKSNERLLESQFNNITLVNSECNIEFHNSTVEA